MTAAITQIIPLKWDNNFNSLYDFIENRLGTIGVIIK